MTWQGKTQALVILKARNRKVIQTELIHDVYEQLVTVSLPILKHFFSCILACEQEILMVYQLQKYKCEAVASIIPTRSRKLTFGYFLFDKKKSFYPYFLLLSY